MASHYLQNASQAPVLCSWGGKLWAVESDQHGFKSHLCVFRQIIQIILPSVVKTGLTTSTLLGCFEDNRISKRYKVVNSVNGSYSSSCHSTLALIQWRPVWGEASGLNTPQVSHGDSHPAIFAYLQFLRQLLCVFAVLILSLPF